VLLLIPANDGRLSYESSDLKTQAQPPMMLGGCALEADTATIAI
jgi:hypothetical protein